MLAGLPVNILSRAFPTKAVIIRVKTNWMARRKTCDKETMMATGLLSVVRRSNWGICGWGWQWGGVAIKKNKGVGGG